MCACKHCNVKLSLYYWTHCSCWWVCHFKKHRYRAIFHNNLDQGDPRLRAWRATLRFKEKFAGRKERNSTEIERLVCCSNGRNICCTPNAIFYSFDSRVHFKFSLCLFATYNRDFLLEKKYTTDQQNDKIIFLGLVIKSMSAVVSAVILFRESLFNRFIVEKTISRLKNMGSTFSVQSLLSGGNCPAAPLVAGLFTLELFQNCFPRISVVFPGCFLVFGPVMTL